MREPFSYERLHPKARQPFQLLSIRLEEAYRSGASRTLFKPFEGYRSPEAQLAHLKAKTSKAGPWESAHNYGLAVDYVAWLPDKPGHWSWDKDHDWDALRDCAVNRGLINAIAWDRPHVEHAIWTAIRSHLI